MGGARREPETRAHEAMASHGLRRCLRPDRCPYAVAAGTARPSASTWVRALAAVLPGDPFLALELVADLADSGAI